MVSFCCQQRPTNCRHRIFHNVLKKKQFSDFSVSGILHWLRVCHWTLTLESSLLLANNSSYSALIVEMCWLTQLIYGELLNYETSYFKPTFASFSINFWIFSINYFAMNCWSLFSAKLALWLLQVRERRWWPLYYLNFILCFKLLQMLFLLSKPLIARRVSHTWDIYVRFHLRCNVQVQCLTGANKTEPTSLSDRTQLILFFFTDE